MAPKLYINPISPPARAVLMCANVLGIELELVNVNLLEADNLKEDYLKKNPQYTVPLLEEEDGFVLPDSHAIMPYLVAQYGKNDSLYPKNDNRQRAIIDHRLHFDSSVLFTRGLCISKPLMFFGEQPSEEKQRNLREAYQFLDKIIEQSGTQFIAGNTVTLADFSIIACLVTFHIFFPYSCFPNIIAYVERFKKLSCYEINKEGLDIFSQLCSNALKKGHQVNS
nr:glutathione S-transferase [Dendroctonus rhizophagus]